jgi:DNA-directed RNA polymerase
LYALPAQGESLITLAYDLGLRTFNRHVVQQKWLSNQVEELKQRYTRYLQLLASDTQVRQALGTPPSLCCLLVIQLCCFLL